MKQCVPAHKWVSLQNKMFIFFDKNFRYVGFILGLILYTQCDNMLPSVLALLISSISLLQIFHAKIILSAVFLPSMVSGHHQQHHHPQHDLHQNLPEVWPVGRQPGQHCLRPGLLHWAAAATGTCTCMHTHAHTHTHTHQQPYKNTSDALSFIRYDTGMGWFGEKGGSVWAREDGDVAIKVPFSAHINMYFIQILSLSENAF